MEGGALTAKAQIVAERVGLTLLAIWFALDSKCQSGATLPRQEITLLKDGQSYDNSASAVEPKTDMRADEFSGNDFAVVLSDGGLLETGIWDQEMGGGFQPRTQTLSLEAGGTYGLAVFGSRQKHDLALMSLSYGYMPGHAVEKGRWYEGNWEVRAELFGGSQFSPNDAWLVGLTPHVRYNFVSCRPWVPFIDAGAGITGTGIGHPDLGETFEFNLQAGLGVHWFVRPDWAVTVEAKLFHMSCARITTPNLGVNGLTGMIGLTRFF